MSDFKAKMHQIRFRLGLRPRPRWGSLQRFPRSGWISGGPLCSREGKGSGKGKGMGRERNRREGVEEGTGKGDRGNGRNRTGQDMGWGGDWEGSDSRKGMGREERGLQPQTTIPGAATDCGGVLLDAASLSAMHLEIEPPKHPGDVRFCLDCINCILDLDCKIYGWTARLGRS